MNVSFSRCGKCNLELPNGAYNATDFVRCPSCHSELRVDIYPALFDKPTGVQSGQSLIIESEASCFYHEKKKAVVPCESCGRFLCALCDVELGDQHLCPGCLQVGKKKGKLRNLENHRTLYDNIALGLAVLPALMIWPSVVTAPMAVFVAIRHWKTPSSILPRTKVRFIFAIVFAAAQITGWSVVFYNMFA